MSLTDYIEKYQANIDPRLWRGLDPALVKMYLESLFWRLSGYKAMVNLPVEQVDAFLNPWT